METTKTIFVTGATGNQGGAVVRSLIQKGFRAKALTRNSDSPISNGLKKIGAEMVQGDLNNVSSFRNELQGVAGIFSVQTFENGISVELRQGKDLADLAKAYNIPHFVYASVMGADLNTGIPHFESKLQIENHIKQLNLPYTIIRPASLFENFLIPAVKSRILKGKLSTPVNKNVKQQLIASRDIGEISTAAFLDPDRYLGKTINVAAEEMDMEKISDIFSKAMGREIKYQKLPMLIARLVMGKDLHKMFKWINEHDLAVINDLTAFRKEYPDLLDLKDWIKLKFTGL